MIDDYERKYGPCDRTEFEGEFVVPPELRNKTNTLNMRALKLHGGFLGLSKSRTFLTLPVRHKQNIHASVPDLSRSVPTTPGSNHKISLAASCDSVLEEPELEQVADRNTSSGNRVIKYVFTEDGVQLRRKSEDMLDARQRSQHIPKSSTKVHPNQMGGSAGRAFNSMQLNHVRQNSDPSSRYIPVRAKLYKPPLTSLFDSMKNRSGSKSTDSISGHSLYSIASSPDNSPNETPVKTGGIKTSTSFASELGVNVYSTCSIPRVNLTNQKPYITKIDLNKSSEDLYKNGTDSAA